MTEKNFQKDSTKKYYTHGGIFHTDDVLSVALLTTLGVTTPAQVGRIRSAEEVEDPDNAILLDIGRGQYDHHQLEVDGDGFKDCTFTILLKDPEIQHLIAEKYDVTDELAVAICNQIFREFGQAIAMTDNFGQVDFPSTLAYLISSLTIRKDTDEGFIYACTVLSPFIDAMLMKVKAFQLSVEEAKQLASEQGEHVVSEHYISTLAFEGLNVRTLVYPATRGGFNLMSDNHTDISAAKDMEGCTFFHSPFFMASFDSMENAVKAVETI